MTCMVLIITMPPIGGVETSNRETIMAIFFFYLSKFLC